MSAANGNADISANYRRKENVSVVNVILNKAGIYFIALLLVIAGIFINKGFFTADNFLNILRAVSLLGIVASGVAFITYSGHFVDMSTPAIMAFAGSMAVTALPLGIVPAVIIGILSGMAVGLMNGLVVGYLKANPILWTLAVVFAMEGFMRFTWSNNQVYPDLTPGSPGEAFIKLFRISIGNIPLFVFIMLLFILIGHFVMTRTKFGLHTKLVGSAIDVAKCTGVNVPRIVALDFVVASFCSSIGGILLTSMNKFGVFYLGQGYDFDSVTAIVIGGMTLAGGRGNMFGVLGGTLVMGLLRNLMTFIGITTFVQSIVTGSVFIIVVAINSYYLRKLGKDYV